MKKGKVTLGTISHATLWPEDLIPAFAHELQRLRGALPQAVAWHYTSWRSLVFGSATTRQDVDGDELLQDLIDALNEYAPDYCYFGAHPGDGADFGFWLCEEWQQMARDDGVLFVADLSEVPVGHSFMVCVVNDHGNATLYATQDYGVKGGKLREIWSVV